MTVVQNFRQKICFKGQMTRKKSVPCSVGVKMHRKYQNINKVSEVGMETKAVSTMPGEAGEHDGYHITQG